MKNKDLLLAIILKQVGLLVFVLILVAGFFTIVKDYDKTISNDDWFIATSSISWTIVCFFNGYLEYNKLKK